MFCKKHTWGSGKAYHFLLIYGDKSDIQKNYNLTYLFITHDLGVVRNVSNRVVVLKNGEIVEEGETAEVFQRPKHEYTKNLIRSIPVVSAEEEKIKP